MSEKKRSLCPACGKHASGNFCHHCGAPLGGRFCNECGAELKGDGRFCNQCGAPVKGAAPPARSGGGSGPGGRAATAKEPVAAAAGEPNNLPWWIAGFALFALIVVVGWNMVQPAGPAAPAGGAPAPGAVNPNAPGTTDISQMSPREAADRLFNRVMSAASEGDTVGAQGFLPMAMQAYELARPLDMDGLFHLSLLQQTAGQPDAALATAQEILATEPNHILGLGAAAEALNQMGRTDEARQLYEQLLEHIDEEAARPLPEYQGHTNYFETSRQKARDFLGR